jgi:hypothetical protein
MKLDCKSAALAFVLLAAVTGCGTRSAAPVASPRNPISTIQLMAAELQRADDAPKVGKSQRSDASLVDDEGGKADDASPSRSNAPDRKHGGFSGYK